MATVDFLMKIVENTPANTDQDHIPVILYGDCTIPDRTMSIEGVGRSPLPKLLRGVKHLVDAGVGAICIPCNSAHYWYKELQESSIVPIINIVDAAVTQLKVAQIDAKTIGVLSTYGTYRTKVYANRLQEAGYRVVEPLESDFHSLITPGIAFVKANEIKAAESLFIVASQNLQKRGAESIILGCTEIPLGLRAQCGSQPHIYVDSTDALAKTAVEFFKNNRHSYQE